MVSTRQMTITTVGPEMGECTDAPRPRMISYTLLESNRVMFDYSLSTKGSTSAAVMAHGSMQTRIGTTSTANASTQPTGAVCKQAGNNATSSASTSTAVQSITPAIHLVNSPGALSLLDMPYEILDKIFSYAGYKQVAHMRLVSGETSYTFRSCVITCILMQFRSLICQVSKQMDQICKAILNSTFTKLQTQMFRRFQNIKKIMPRR